MVKTSAPNTNRIMLPAPKSGTQSSSPQAIHKLPPVLRLQWAPAWFYSALEWLGKVYYDANNTAQSFNTYMAGSDVDPYAQIGSTRLFLIVRLGAEFRLSIAPDAASSAPAADGTLYPNTDEGIREMYLALAGSHVFASVKYCYIPGRIGSDLDPSASGRLASLGGPLENGYDAATGLRAVVLGSAVSQVVPVDDFIKRNNEQIYNPSPVIVPLVTALVYDLSKYNTLGATTFTLPTIYSRDRISAGTDMVSKAGQTVVFAGGPGFDDASAIALQLENTSTVTVNGIVFTTFTFDKATVVTAATMGSKVETGIAELTYHSLLPSSVFANQQFLGFYRDNGWTNTLGIPIWDYGVSNKLFTAKTDNPVTPVTIFDPATSFLNGGSLQNVVQSLGAASYLYAWDILYAMIQEATTGQDAQGVGLAATAAALNFAVSANSSNTPIVDKLDVPILATVTTTPVVFNPPVPEGDRPPIQIDAANGMFLPRQQVIGGGGNTPKPTTPGPITVQAALSASIPREALDGTHISSIESGTVFPLQPLGAGQIFQSLTAGTIVNLMERHNLDAAFPWYDLPIANLGVGFREGVAYVLSLSSNTLSVRGSDGFTASIEWQAPDAMHTFVGSTVYGASTTSVRLYPKLSLPLPPPAVGTQGVLQGETYNIRFTFGGKTSSYDLLDSNQVPIARQVSVSSPQPTDNSSPRPGDLYFGNFTGGDTEMLVWSVPVSDGCSRGPARRRLRRHHDP